MTTTGQLTAKPPVSPHANLTAVERVGTNKAQGAVWRVACSCGATMTAAAYAVRIGETKCPRCQPCPSDQQAIEILMLLPATYDDLVSHLGVLLPTLKSRIRSMKARGFCRIGKWRRPRGAGDFQPVIVPGPGADAPCTLAPRTNAEHKRKHVRRVKRAIAKAAAGGKEDPRYIRHIALYKATETVKRARTEPQTPFSALFTGRPA